MAEADAAGSPGRRRQLKPRSSVRQVPAPRSPAYVTPSCCGATLRNCTSVKFRSRLRCAQESPASLLNHKTPRGPALAAYRRVGSEGCVPRRKNGSTRGSKAMSVKSVALGTFKTTSHVSPPSLLRSSSALVSGRPSLAPLSTKSGLSGWIASARLCLRPDRRRKRQLLPSSSLRNRPKPFFTAKTTLGFEGEIARA